VCFLADTVPPFFQVRDSRMVRQVPATFDRSKPFGLFAVNPAAIDLKSENEKGRTQSSAIYPQWSFLRYSEGGLTAFATSAFDRLRSIGSPRTVRSGDLPSSTPGLNAHDQHAAQQRAMHLGAATSSPEGTEYRCAEPKQMVSISVCEVKMESV
jgi:hypothetical protein